MKVLWLLYFTALFITQNEVTAKKNPQTINSFAGPYKILIRKLGPCPPSDVGKNIYILSGCIKQTRERPQPSFYGNMETTEPLNDEITMTASLAKWNPVSGWVQNAFILPFGKVCTGLKSMVGDTVRSLEQHALHGEKFCPRGVGNFTVVGAPAVLRMDKIKIFPYGKWQGDVKFYRENTLVGCFQFHTESIPDNAVPMKRSVNSTSLRHTDEHSEEIGTLIRNKRSACAIQGI